MVLQRSTRDYFAIDVWKEVSIKGVPHFVLFKKYTFISNLNHGLARQTGVLPAEIPFRIKFHRAPSGFLLLKVEENVKAKTKADPTKIINVPYSYEERVIPILNPVMKCFYA